MKFFLNIFTNTIVKKGALHSLLFIFVFQTIVFNAFLFLNIALAKIEANEFKEGTTRLILTESQYKNVQWINTSEFIFDGNLYDLKEAQKSIDKTILVCKMDVKEKDFLEKLIEAFKQSKTKKNVAFSFTAKLTNPITVSHFFYIDCILNHTTNYSLLAIRVSKNTPPPKI